MVKALKNGIAAITLLTAFAAAAFTPAINTAAEEASPINAFAKEMLENHAAEIEADEKAKKREQLVKESRIADIQKMEAQMKELTKANRELTIEENKPHLRPIGTYQLTAYIATGNRCASGVYPRENHTVACNSIRMGTKIYIEGYGEYVVEDTGGMSGGVIDVFVSDYGTAIQFGRRTAQVYIIED
ncbi:MAG: 3D domain-containing protein [Eubacterium sp.]|nr:3D domain-containing protein [Eubacterium sp.]